MRFPEYESTMKDALSLAQKAYDCGEVPVGCVIVNNKGETIACAHNSCEADGMTSSHAEIRAIDAAQKAGADLSQCTLYTTLEPCGMCAGAIAHARVSRVVFGAFDENFGCMVSKINLPHIMGCATECIGGVCEGECKSLLDKFFSELRQ